MKKRSSSSDSARAKEWGSEPKQESIPARLPGEKLFRWRGGEVSRIEGLSDGVLALAMTLLIVSLEVPEDIEQLLQTFKQLPAFAASFAILVMCWFYNHQFHRRYGLEDFGTIVLNSLYLFLILFYVYPLKYLNRLLLDPTLPESARQMNIDQVGDLMLLYSGGYVGIFAIMAAMYWRAWRLRERLELNAVERGLTKLSWREMGLHILIGMSSIGIALVGGEWTPFSGMIFILIGPTLGLHGYLSGRRLPDPGGLTTPQS